MKNETEYCQCGYQFKPTLYMKLIMLIKGEYVKTCPRCQSMMVLHMSHFVYVKNRKNNLNTEIWKNG